MDISTVVGLAAGVFFVLFGIMVEGAAVNPADLVQFINIPSVLIVVGGTVGSTFISYPLDQMMNLISVTRNAFFQQEESHQRIIETLVGFAETARREGILSLEQRVQTLDDDFLKNGINLAVDGTEPEYIKEIMTTEMEYIAERHKLGAGMFDMMALYSPAFGMIGTLIGLIKMLKSLDDPSTIGPKMGVALITTLYGSMMANMIFTPLASKLRERSAHEQLVKQLSIQGIMAIQSGDNPRIVEGKLQAFIAPSKRIRNTRREA